MATAAVRDGKSMLARLSRTPRFAGSVAEADAREFCRRDLESSGLTCTEREFEYSQWPGLWGPPVAAGAQLVTILIVARTARNGEPLVALMFGLAIFIALALVSRDAKRRWTMAMPFLRTRAINLEAARGNPSLWLVAHIDSKSQTVPMLYRIASVVFLNLVTLIALGVLVMQLAGHPTIHQYWLAVALAAGIVSLPSLLCLVRNDSPGAVDNASGVAAVLLAARQIPRDRAVGVLVTSGEELGLAGARAWAIGARSDMRVINCDTLDDSGTWLCMHTGARPGVSVRAATTAGRLGFNLRVRRLIPGILADSVAFSDRGLEAVTISRGTLATLARIHTRRDNSTQLAGSGIGEAAALLAALTMELG